MFVNRHSTAFLSAVALAFVLSTSCRQQQSNISAQSTQQERVNAPATTKVVADQTFVLRFDGIGRAKVGMTTAELRASVSENLKEEESGSEDCFYLVGEKHPQLAFMLIDGRLSRIDVSDEGISNLQGISVGDPISRVHEVYGKRVKVTDHQYSEGEHYLTVRSKDGRYGVRFETQAGKVAMFYAGRYESIQYVEGCL